MTSPEAQVLFRLLVVADGDLCDPQTNSGVALGISTALAARGDVDLIATRGAMPTGVLRLALAFFTIRPTRKWWWESFNFGALNIFARSLNRDAIARRDPHSVILHIRNIYLPAKRPYIAFIDTTAALSEKEWEKWKLSSGIRRIRRRVEERYLKNANFVFTAGQKAAESVVRDYSVSADRVASVGGGVNFSPFPDIVGETSGPTVLWVGKDFSRKGGDALVSAFAHVRKEIPNAVLILVGEAPPLQIDGVRVIGLVSSRDEMADLYRSARVFCLPARHEPFGLVVPEAMSFALPCVVSAANELPRIVQDGVTGAVVSDIENHSNLAEALLAYLRDPVLARSHGMAARVRAQNEFTWTAVAERMIIRLRQQSADGWTTPIPRRHKEPSG